MAIDRYHVSTSIKQTIHLTIDLDAVVNFYVVVIDSISANVKQLSIYPEAGFNSDDITVIDNKTVEVRIQDSETTDWKIGNYHFQLFATYSDPGFDNSIRIDSNSRVVFRLVKDNVPTQEDPDITMNLPYNVLPEAPIDGNQYARKDAGWEVVAGGGGGAVQFVISAAASDVLTDLEVGTDKAVFFAPYDMTITSLFIGVHTSPVGSNLIADINVNGTSILSTKVSIDDGEATSLTAATPPVISSTALTLGDKITVDIGQIGAATAGSGLTVYIKGVL